MSTARHPTAPLAPRRRFYPAAATVLVAPLFHRVLHRFRIEDIGG